MSVRKRNLKSGKITWEYCIELGIDANGKRIQERRSGFESKKDAEAEERKRLNEIDLGYCDDKMTFEKGVKLFIDNAELSYAYKTVDKYKSHFKNHLSEFMKKVYKDIRLDFINSWKYKMLDEGKTNHTINDCIKLLKAMGAYLCKHEYALRNPFEYVDKLPVTPCDKKVFNLRQITRMLRRARREQGRLYPLLYTAIFTEMRQGELLGLEWKNIDFENKKLYVRQQFNGKTLTPKLKTATSRRTIDLTDGVVECLLEYKRVLPELHDLVFCTKLGTPLLSANIRERWYYPLLRSFKWEGYEFHSLRHTYASLMLSQGVPYLYVSKQMGHAKPTVTLNVYGHFIPDENENAVAKLEDMYRNYLNGINNKLLKRNCGEHGIKNSFSEIQA